MIHRSKGATRHPRRCNCTNGNGKEEENTPGTQKIRGWVGLRADLDTETGGKILCLCWESNPSHPVCTDTILTGLLPLLPLYAVTSGLEEHIISVLRRPPSASLLPWDSQIQFLYASLLQHW
jgi:hypothetical protein